MDAAYPEPMTVVAACNTILRLTRPLSDFLANLATVHEEEKHGRILAPGFGVLVRSAAVSRLGAVV